MSPVFRKARHPFGRVTPHAASALLPLGAFTLAVWATGLLAGCSAAATDTTQSEAALISDVENMQRRPDGKFDVVCRDGRHEVADQAQVLANEVCGPAVVPPMPSARRGLAAVATKSGIFVLGGYGHLDPATEGCSSAVEVYSPATNAWTSVASLPSPRYGLTAAADVDGRIYAIGGIDQDNDLITKIAAYDPIANVWKTVGHLPTPRYNLAAATGPDGRIYVIGGHSMTGALSTVEAYTPSTNTWETLASLPSPRVGLAAAVGPDGRIYAIGGESAVDANPANSVYAYTPSQNTWESVANLPTAREGLAATVGSDQRIYAVGGIAVNAGGGGTTDTAVEAYVPSTNTWAPVPSLPRGRWELAAVTGTDGRLFALGGDEIETKVSVYTPSKGAWE